MHKEVIQTCFLAITAVRVVRYLLLFFGAGQPMLLHILFYVPLAVSFIASTVLFVTWLDVLAYVSGKGKEGASRVFYGTVAFDLVVLLVAIALFCFEPRISIVPFIFGVFAYDMTSFKQLVIRWRNAKVRWDSPTAKQFSTLTCWVLLACFSVLLLATTLLGFGVAGFWLRSYTNLITEQVFCLVAEASLLFALLFVVSNLAFETNLTAPKAAGEVTAEWVTDVLRESNAIGEGMHVATFPADQLEQLRGGCHSDVRKLELEYEDSHGYRTAKGRAPGTVVVKFLCWQKTFWEKVKVFATYKLPGLHSKESDYVKSYKIESYFYDRIAKGVRGVQLPRIYFNYADTFNVHFGVVMEDVTRGNESLAGGVVSGQPHGFTFDESKVILCKLARFHAQFWQDPALRSYEVWDIGGFWTGDKRQVEKSRVVAAWAKVYSSHGEHHRKAASGGSSPVLGAIGENSNCAVVQLGTTTAAGTGAAEPAHDKLVGLGARLERNATKINEVYMEMCRSDSSFLTLIHGDFKISNLFIDIRPRSPPLRTGYALPKTCGDENDRNVWTIDWQWVGRGVAAIDVAYYLCTSTRPDLLSRSAFKKQVKQYYSVLLERGVKGVTFKELWMQVRLCVLDFVVYCIVSKWCNMTTEDFEKNQSECKDGMQVRSVQHMHRLIDIAVAFLDELGFN